MLSVERLWLYFGAYKQVFDLLLRESDQEPQLYEPLLQAVYTTGKRCYPIENAAYGMPAGWSAEEYITLCQYWMLYLSICYKADEIGDRKLMNMRLLLDACPAESRNAAWRGMDAELDQLKALRNRR